MREPELRTLEELLRGETQVICLHGIAGMGKSAILRAFVRRAHEGGASVIELDCRTVEPTESGFLRAVGGLGGVRELAPHLRGLVPTVVFTLDHYEVFRLMDTWLRQVLVPSLPAGVSLVLAGRERPAAAWFALDGFRSVQLHPLADADACSLLERSESRRARRRG